VHKAGPDVLCAAHTHSCFGRAFATLGIPLLVTSQDGCAFFEDVALYGEFEGIVLEGSEGKHIAQAIGSKKAGVLQNHGLLTCANSVEATVFWYVSLEKLCQTQLLATAAVGGDMSRIKQVGEKEAKKSVFLSLVNVELTQLIHCSSYLSLGPPTAGWFSAKALFDCIA
jgi:ribulose-5-phosphate 4-epimerase/fuculose-1-phosphate aldolase